MRCCSTCTSISRRAACPIPRCTARPASRMPRHSEPPPCRSATRLPPMRPDRPSGRSPAQIADHNSRTLLETLRRSGPLTRNELSARLGLTIPGITNITRRLLDEGLITEARRKIPGAAVPTAHYALDPDGAFAIGLRPRDGTWEGVLV